MGDLIGVIDITTKGENSISSGNWSQPTLMQDSEKLAFSHTAQRLFLQLSCIQAKASERRHLYSIMSQYHESCSVFYSLITLIFIWSQRLEFGLRHDLASYSFFVFSPLFCYTVEKSKKKKNVNKSGFFCVPTCVVGASVFVKHFQFVLSFIS